LRRLFATLSAAATRAKQIEGKSALRRRFEITVEREVVTTIEGRPGESRRSDGAGGDEEHCSACGQLILAQLSSPMAPPIDGLPVEDRATNQPIPAPLSSKPEVTP
jgi:hypothetical protein